MNGPKGSSLVEAAAWRSLDRTLPRYPDGARAFCEELHEEHWTEAAWLYERRETLEEQRSEVPLAMWADVEARAVAHVDALAVGGSMVAEQWVARGLQGEPGELHTALRLACRAGKPEPLLELLAGLREADPLRRLAAEDAMAWELPTAGAELVGTLSSAMIDAANDAAMGVLTRVIGRRRWPLERAIGRCFTEGRGDPEALAWVAGRLGWAWALPGLQSSWSRPVAPAVKRAAAIACLRLDPSQTLASLRAIVKEQPWAALPLAMAGDGELLPSLLAASKHGEGPLPWWALGVLGHVGAVEPLLAALSDPTRAVWASEALHLLTGAELFEEVWIEAPADAAPTAAKEEADQAPAAPPDDDDFAGLEGLEGLGSPEGLEDLEEPEPEPPPEPAPAPEDEEPGELVRRLSTQREVWSQWLREHPLPGPEARVRFGRPFHFDVTLEHLRSTTLGRPLRAVLIEELSLRYGLPLTYWPWQLVAEQRTALAADSQRLGGLPRRPDGTWVVPRRSASST
jgi:hypothetical protein